MKPVVLGTLMYALFAAAPSLLFPIMALYPQSQTRPDVMGDFLMAAYLVGVSTAFRTIGFVIPTALSKSWRRLRTGRAMLIAGILGLLSPIAGFLTLILIGAAVLPLFHSAAWVATGLLYGLPGLLLGGIAVLIAARKARAAKIG